MMVGLPAGGVLTTPPLGRLDRDSSKPPLSTNDTRTLMVLATSSSVTVYDVPVAPSMSFSSTPSLRVHW